MIRNSGTSLDLTYLACKTHGVHVLAFGPSRNSISPLSSLPREFSGLSLPSRLPLSLAVSGVLPRHRADLRSPSSLSPPLCPFRLALPQEMSLFPQQIFLPRWLVSRTIKFQQHQTKERNISCRRWKRGNCFVLKARPHLQVVHDFLLTPSCRSRLCC